VKLSPILIISGRRLVMASRQKQAYLFEYPSLKREAPSFWRRVLLWKTEATRLREIFGELSLKGPFDPEDDTIVDGYLTIN